MLARFCLSSHSLPVRSGILSHKDTEKEVFLKKIINTSCSVLTEVTLIKYLEPYGIALCVTTQAVYFWELVYVKQSQILTFMFKIGDTLWEQPMQSDYSLLGTMQNIEHAPPHCIFTKIS